MRILILGQDEYFTGKYQNYTPQISILSNKADVHTRKQTRPDHLNILETFIPVNCSKNKDETSQY
jgi:hypothetical protein